MKIILTENQYEKLSKELTEDPDMVRYNDELLTFDEPDAVTFGFYDNHPFVGFNDWYGKRYIHDINDYKKEKGYFSIDNIHLSIPKFNKYLNDRNIYDKLVPLGTDRRTFTYPGRLWLNSGVISFYEIPPKEQYYHYVDMISDLIQKVYGVDVNLHDFKININDTRTIINPEDYAEESDITPTNYDINKIHLLPADIKRDTPQMKANRALKDKIDKERFKKTPEYLWNYWKTKNLAENDNAITKLQLNNLVNAKDIDEMAYPSSFNMEEFKSINSFAGRVKYCRTHLKRLAEGSSRMVFQIDDEKVLKLAKNRKGLAQNMAEADMGYNEGYFDCIAKVFDYEENNYFFVEMELARKCSPADFKRVTEYDFETFVNFIQSELNGTLKKNFTDDFIDNAYDENSIMTQVIDFIHSWDLPAGDLYRIEHYGIVKRNGEEYVVIIDYGLTDKVLKQHYQRKG